jgi:hypothetical protein
VKKNTHPKWPEPPKNLRERLLHVLDIFEDCPDEMPVLSATTNVYAPHGEEHSWTGLTLGDLRTVGAILVGRLYTLDEAIGVEAEGKR